MQYIYLTTTDSTILIVLAVLMGLFFVLGCIAMVFVIKLLTSLQRVAVSAENVVDSVEAAAQTLKNTTGRYAFFKLLKNITDLAGRKK